MFVQMSIHRVKSGAEPAMVASMLKFGAAIKDAPGLFKVMTLRNPQKLGEFFGIALWETQADCVAARPLMIEAVKDDPFDEWEVEETQVFRLLECHRPEDSTAS